jgi:hypothetical protein
MSDLELLFLVLTVLYGWECSCWLRRGSVAFVTWFGRRWRVFHPGSLLGNQRGGLIFAPPLPPLGTLVAGNQFPLSLSPEAVLAFVSPSMNPGWRPPQTGKLFRWDEIRDIETSGKKVLVKGQVLLNAVSTTFAQWLAEELRQLGRLAPSKRASAIEKIIRDRFDTRAIERRWKEFQRQTASTKLLTNCVFTHLFIVAPILLSRWGLRPCWLGLVLGLFAMTITTAILFRRVHKSYYPGADEERFTHFLTILLAPATTIRAHDVLSRPLLESFHPLAIAKVFCSDQEFREFARGTLREVSHPGLPLCPRDELLAQAAEAHTRVVLLKTIEAFLKRNGLAPETLLLPPTPTDEACRSYCPRCLAQFTTPTGACTDCGGLELAPLAASVPGAKPALRPES